MAEKEGRPTVMTPEIIGKLEQAFLMGCSDKEACLFADIHPSTLYDYQKLNPDFTERKALLKEEPIFRARQTVINDIEKNVDSAKWFLERKKKDEFSLRSEITGKNGEPIEVKEIKDATDEDLYKLVNGNNTTTSQSGVSQEGAGAQTPA